MSDISESELQDYATYFADEHYLVRRKVLKLMGGAFHVYNTAGEVVMYSKMKAFKLKEDIRLYTGEDMTKELLCISARSVLDFGATYDVIDSGSGVKVGALRRKAMKSILKDEWLILGANDQEIGKIVEDSTLKAVLRRFVDFAALLMPQKYHVEMDEQTLTTMQQNFNPFVYKLDVDFSGDGAFRLDRRLGMAAAILLAAIEGKQS
ncbi:hypothetical protein [Poriferisphaera sp. WC338]|uniref:hypothetical protein n=1 Tax=Poriferisphaera sp. WC338 TaxID=3425129 RepID=UPI003D81BC4C